jgi:hypothetical protein
MIFHATQSPAGGARQHDTTGPGQAGEPDVAVATVAARLAGHGLAVGFPDLDDLHVLKATARNGASCTVSVEGESADCEYQATPPCRIQPHQAVAIIAALFGTEHAAASGQPGFRRGLSVTGAVGREMKARGLAVSMNVVEDHDSYQAFADIAITSPARPGRGTVYFGADGWIFWDCRISNLPHGTASFADAIAAALSHAPPVTPGKISKLTASFSRNLTRALPRVKKPGGRPGWS